MFKNDGYHLAQTHLPRVNENSTVEHLERVEELKKHNANIKEYNDIIDKLIESGHTQEIDSIRPLVSEFKHDTKGRMEYLMRMIQHIRSIYNAVMERIKTPTYEQNISFKNYATAAKKNVSKTRFGTVKKQKKIKIYDYEK